MNMKVSTSFLFDQATDRMSTIQGRLSRTQAQLAESKQILAPSDSPDQAAAIERLRGEISRQEGHGNLLKTALQRFTAEETALTSAGQILARIKELATQAANDTFGPDDRRAIAVEMQALRNQLVSIGNTRDDNGNYLFSGTRVTTPAFATDVYGKVVYQGDQTQTRVPAGVERTVQFTRAGSDVYTRVVRTDTQGEKTTVAFFDALDELIAAANSNNGPALRRGLGEVDQMQFNMSLAIAQCGSDQLVVQSQSDVLEQTTLRLKSTLSSIEDLDYTEAVARMNKEMTALEAAMASFGKISSLSLFDHLR
jgi:flagellar hook-associated protein 3 FlgL